jgi:hypothetical protein
VEVLGLWSSHLLGCDGVDLEEEKEMGCREIGVVGRG